MSLLMRRRFLDSQRKNGLYTEEASQSFCVKPVESQFNYNAQNCQAADMAVPMNSSNNSYYVAPTPMNGGQQQQQQQQQQHHLECIQEIKGAERDHQQPNETQADEAINPILHKGDSKAANPNSRIEDALAEGAYYDTPVYMSDPVTYQQQQHSNAIKAPHLAQLPRCSHAACMHCKRTHS